MSRCTVIVLLRENSLLSMSHCHVVALKGTENSDRTTEE